MASGFLGGGMGPTAIGKRWHLRGPGEPALAGQPVGFLWLITYSATVV